MADVTTVTGIGIQVLTTSEIESTIIQDSAGSGLTRRRGEEQMGKRNAAGKMRERFPSETKKAPSTSGNSRRRPRQL
mgnify:CR=1 FL=1